MKYSCTALLCASALLTGCGGNDYQTPASTFTPTSTSAISSGPVGHFTDDNPVEGLTSTTDSQSGHHGREWSV